MDHSLSVAPAFQHLCPREQPCPETAPGGASLQLLRIYPWGTGTPLPFGCWLRVGGDYSDRGFGYFSDFGVPFLLGHLLPLSSQVALWSGEQKAGQYLETISAGLGWEAVASSLL